MLLIKKILYSAAFEVNPVPHDDNFSHSFGRKLLKTFWEKEKMLMPAFSSFSSLISTQ